MSSQLTQMLRLTKTRINYLDKFQQQIDEYNSSYRNVETLFADLVEFAQEINFEDKRAISENWAEEELAISDLLTKPAITLTKKKSTKSRK
ncbi:hypothetical protein QUA54_12210 [Microcoleus sp. MOSTC5]